MTAAVTPAGYCSSKLSSWTQVHSWEGLRGAATDASTLAAFFCWCDASTMRHCSC